MSEPTPIYVVTRGDYSAYSILGAYLDRSAAQEFVDKLNRTSDEMWYRDQAEIEEWPDATQPGEPKGVWTIRVDSDDWDVDWDWSRIFNPKYEVRIGPIELSEHRDSGGTVYLKVEAVDLERGKKVIYDRMAEIKAEMAGLT